MEKVMISNYTLPIWFDYLEDVVGYSFMLAVAITLPLYLMEIIILISLRKTFFKGMFFQIFTVGLCVDVISLINNYIGCVFPAKGWFTNIYLLIGPSVGHVYLITAYTTRLIQGFTVLALATNRATAVCLPIKHKRIWNSKYASLIHVFQIGFGGCIGFSLIRKTFHWKFEYRGLYIQFDDLDFRLKLFVAAYIIESIFVAVIIFINVTMLICFKKNYKTRTISMPTTSQSTQKVLNEKQRQENNLTIVAVLTCGAEIIYYIYVIYTLGINTNVPTRVFYLLYDVVNDIYCGLSGWLLIIYSSSMRAHVTKMLSFPNLGCQPLIVNGIPVSSATRIDGFGRNTLNKQLPSYGTAC